MLLLQQQERCEGGGVGVLRLLHDDHRIDQLILDLGAAGVLLVLLLQRGDVILGVRQQVDRCVQLGLRLHQLLAELLDGRELLRCQAR